MQKRKCPKCGAEVFASDDVCMDCGADLAALRREREPHAATSEDRAEAPREQAEAQGEAPPHERERPAPMPAAFTSWLWVPGLRSPTRYPVLRVYQYVCMVSAWGSLLSGMVGALLLILGWASLRGALPEIPADLDLVGIAIGVGVTLLWSIFWAFTLRAAVEAIQVYLDIEENTRRSAEAAGTVV